MADDPVLEIHGVASTPPNSSNWVRVSETENGNIFVMVATGKNPQLSPKEARYLGRKLLRLARRIEQRSAS